MGILFSLGEIQSANFTSLWTTSVQFFFRGISTFRIDW